MQPSPIGDLSPAALPSDADIALELPGYAEYVGPRAYPELDLTKNVKHTWLHEATPTQIEAKRAAGDRLFRISVARSNPLRFSAVFVRNVGSYARAGHGWEYGLDKAGVEAKAADPKVRLVCVSPYRVNGEIRYVVATVSNTGAQHKTYTVILDAGSIDEVRQQAQAFGGRVVQLGSVTMSPQATGDGPVVHVLQQTHHLAAVVVKNVGLDAREQWMGRETVQEINRLVAEQETLHGKPSRVVAIAPDGRDLRFGGTFFYVAETRPHGAYGWCYSGLTAEFTGVPPADGPEPGRVDDFSHVSRRLGARYIQIERYADELDGTVRHVALLTDNGPSPMSGKSASGALAKPLDDVMRRALKVHGIAGATVAVVRQGRLVYARAFGYADVEKNVPATPTMLFRIASVSKPITAAAILKLIEDGATLPGTNTPLTLDTRPFAEIFTAEMAAAQEPAKTDLPKVTIRNLLEMRSGFNPGDAAAGIPGLAWMPSNKSVDGFVTHPKPILTEDAFGNPCEPGDAALDRYQNSNFELLGVILERITGLSYLNWVKTYFLEPIASKRIAITLAPPPGQVEVRYYDNISPSYREGRNGADSGGWVSDAVAHACGGFAASAVDLVRLFCAIDGSRAGARLLTDDSFALYSSGGTDGLGQPYGLGFATDANPDGSYDLEHGGVLPGSALSRLRILADGSIVHWAINGWDKLPGLPEVASAIGDGLVQAIRAIPEDDWPSTDLFGSYGFLQPVSWSEAAIYRVRVDVLRLLGVDVNRARLFGVIRPPGRMAARTTRRGSDQGR